MVAILVGLGTTFVMMQTTMLDATTMVVTAVGMVTPLIVLNAFANKNKKLQMICKFKKCFSRSDCRAFRKQKNSE